MSKIRTPRGVKITLLLVASFLLGRAAAHLFALTSHGLVSEVSAPSNWGLSFQDPETPPSGNASAETLRQFDAYYTGDTRQKTIYLTFDAGYENGNMPAILDALKNHQAPAAFFVVGSFISENPELIQRMLDEGHLIGNHTYSHPDMSEISSLTSFSDELSRVASIYEDATGEKMQKLYRPPRGKYSEENLRMAQQLGYRTFFWSLAYVDWQTDAQPSREEAFDKLLGRIHPGAIVLLHSTSSTNAAILDELLTKWENMGYRFASLDTIS